MPLNRLTFLQMLVIPALQPPPEEPTAEMRYRQATDLLIRGKRFERAAELLRKARTQDPNDPRIASALGCALVSRVASLMYASSFTYSLEADHRDFSKVLAAWDKIKNNPDNENLPPQPPPRMTFPTKDDSQPFRMRPEELAKKTTALVAEARRAFETARKIAKTPDAQGEVAYLEGWSLRVLQPFAGEVGEESGILYSETVLGESEESEEMSETEQETPEKKQEAKLYFPKPNDTEILKAFGQATEKYPENALYWQSLGDVLDDPKQIQSAYQKSLERNPRNASLWYRLYRREMDKERMIPPDLMDGEGKPPERERHDRVRALSYLRIAARYDPANGYYATEEASLLFKETAYSSYFNSSIARNGPLSKDSETADYQKTMRADFEKHRQSGATSASKDAAQRAVSLVEKSNQASAWEFPRYREPVPRWLAVARSYTTGNGASVDFPQFATYRELARALSGYGSYLAQEDRDNVQAVRACRAGIGLGMRLIGDWPLKDEPGGSAVIRTLVGFAVVSIGMKILVDVEKRSGTPQRAAQYQAEFDAFNAKVKAYKAALLKIGEEENPYTLY